MKGDNEIELDSVRATDRPNVLGYSMSQRASEEVGAQGVSHHYVLDGGPTLMERWAEERREKGYDTIIFNDAHDGQRVGNVSIHSREPLKQYVDDEGEKRERVASYDAVNPPHYQRGPILKVDIGDRVTRGLSQARITVQCIDIVRWIPDFRLAQAVRYVWRVAFGGKDDPTHQNSREAQDREDIEKAVWYLQDWLTHKLERGSNT